MKRFFAVAVVSLFAATAATGAWAQGTCAGLPSQATLKNALTQAVSDETSGLNLNMWATIVGRDGTVCAVAFSGNNIGAQWLGSRVISAQKANTANLFSRITLQLRTIPARLADCLSRLPTYIPPYSQAVVCLDCKKAIL